MDGALARCLGRRRICFRQPTFWDEISSTPETGFIAAAILATTMRVVWEARWAHVDMVFCAFFVFAVYFGARSLFHKGQPHEILFTYLFIALATLTKGLIGVVLPGLLFLAVMLVRREWRLIFVLKLHLGLPLFFLIAAPWFYLVTRATDGKWLADFIYIHHIQRYTAGAGHRQPFYYYLTTLPADFLPWTIFLIPALFAFRPYRRRWADPVVQFFVLWFFSVFLFFTFSDTKRDLYLLPLMPTLALFVGSYFDDLATGKIALSAAYQGLTIAFFGLVVIAGFAVPCAAWFVRRDAFAAVLPTSLVLLLGGSGAVLFLWRRRPLQAAGVDRSDDGIDCALRRDLAHALFGKFQIAAVVLPASESNRPGHASGLRLRRHHE